MLLLFFFLLFLNKGNVEMNKFSKILCLMLVYLCFVWDFCMDWFLWFELRKCLHMRLVLKCALWACCAPVRLTLFIISNVLRLDLNRVQKGFLSSSPSPSWRRPRARSSTQEENCTYVYTLHLVYKTVEVWRIMTHLWSAYDVSV